MSEVLNQIANMSFQEHENLINAMASDIESRINSVEQSLDRFTKAQIIRALMYSYRYGVVSDSVEFKNKKEEALGKELLNLNQSLVSVVLQAVLLEGREQKGDSNEQQG